MTTKRRLKAIKEFVHIHDNYTCVVCGISADTKLVAGVNGYIIKDKPEQYIGIDHFVPRCKKGHNNIANLMTMCTICNNNKGNKDPFSWLVGFPTEQRSKITERLIKGMELEKTRTAILFLEKFLQHCRKLAETNHLLSQQDQVG
jgi:hypothetical protein